MSNRRDFLHGMGAGALLLGPLSQLARAEAQNSFPLRVFFLFTQAPPTLEDYVWGPNGPIGDLPHLASPLVAFKSKLTPLLGLMNSSGKYAHSHSSTAENILTSHTSPGNTYSPKNESFDAWIDRQLTVNGRVTRPSLRMRVGSHSADFGIHWDAQGNRVPAQTDLSSLYRDVLSGVGPSGAATPPAGNATIDEDKERRRALFSNLQSDYKLFQSR
jgi:hypothetical protein